MYPQKRAFKIQDCHMKFFVDISPGKASGGKKAGCKCLLFKYGWLRKQDSIKDIFN